MGPNPVYPSDIYTEPSQVDHDTLRNLGPLTGIAGIWEGTRTLDINPKAAGPIRQEFVEHIELQPIDPQTNGPQLLYGLRYHTHIVKPGEVETFHDQVGYWLWEPAASTVLHTLAIPRGQVALAAGRVDPDATEFEVNAALGADGYGILSNPFLDLAFRTEAFRIRVTSHGDDTWSYEEHTVLRVPGRAELVDHVDRNTLRRIGAPTPNPLALVSEPDA